MKRWGARSVVVLVLGLLTTIAIAWASAAFGPIVQVGGPKAGEPAFESIFENDWVNHVYEGSSWRRAWWALGSQPPARIWRWQDHRSPGSNQVFASSLDLLQDGRGWPRLALWCEWQCERYPSLNRVEGGIVLPLPRGQSPTPRTVRALPYRIIPWGLTVDTLLFAFAWFILLFAPRGVRRVIRRRRGRCLSCGYDLRGLAEGVCPECGDLREEDLAKEALPSRSSQSSGTSGN